MKKVLCFCILLILSIVLIKHVAYANDFNNIKPIEKGGNAMSEKLKELARGVEEYVLRVRRYLHSMPELRWQEEKNTGLHY